MRPTLPCVCHSPTAPGFARGARGSAAPRSNLGHAVLGVVGVLSMGWFSAACAQPIAPEGVPATQQTPFLRGVGLGLFASDPTYDYAALLDEIVDHHATDVLIVVPWYQQRVDSHHIAPRPGYSPTDATVLRTLQQAKARKLRVSLLPIVRLTERSREEWRGRIRPAAGVGAWFAEYGAFLRKMARLAAAAHVERFGVGSELLSLEREEAEWRSLIASVRDIYDGRLYYSANWDHFDPIRFWDALDEVGVTAYFELTRSEEPPRRAQLLTAWQRPQHDLMRLRARIGKPLIITELGYPSKTTAARYPWDETRAAPIDLPLQALLYEVFCDAFTDKRVLDGVYFWNWFGFGGADDGEYTPRRKPAADVMRECLDRPSWDQGPAGVRAPR
jgi:hypothetical protein